MSHPCDFPLGCVPLDSAQTVRKAWDNCNLAHRTVPVNVDYNIVEHSYDPCGKLTSVEYFHEANAESTKLTVLGDCCSSLNGKAFNLATKDDATRYNILYSVACATAKPASTNGIRYILVNIQACDPAEVVSLATKQAIEADSKGAVDLCVAYAGKFLTITNVVKGCASDTMDVDTGFTFEVLTQGTKTSVETLNYVYNADGRIDKVTTSSGQNKLNINGPFEEIVSIGGNGKVTRVSNNSELAVELAPLQNELLEKIVDEMRVMNLHMSMLTDNTLTKDDLDTIDDL